MLPGPLERDGSIGCGTLILLAPVERRRWPVLGREGDGWEGRGWLGGDGWWEGRGWWGRVQWGEGGTVGKGVVGEGGTPYLVLTQTSSILRRVASNRHVSVT